MWNWGNIDELPLKTPEGHQSNFFSNAKMRRLSHINSNCKVFQNCFMNHFMCNLHCLFIDACKGLLGSKGPTIFCDNICCSDIVFPIFPCVVHFKVKSLKYSSVDWWLSYQWHETQVYQLEIHLLDLSKGGKSARFWNALGFGPLPNFYWVTPGRAWAWALW